MSCQTTFFLFKQIMIQGKRLENVPQGLNLPQDLEWCIHGDGKLVVE
jgi:hypothetical protein